MAALSGTPRRWRQRRNLRPAALAITRSTSERLGPVRARHVSPVGDGSGACGEQPGDRDTAVAEDAFISTVHSAKLQLDALTAIHAALLAESSMNPDLSFLDLKASHAFANYDVAIRSLNIIVDELLRMSEGRTTSIKATSLMESESGVWSPGRAVAHCRTKLAGRMLAERMARSCNGKRGPMEASNPSITAAIHDASDSDSESISASESDACSESGSESGSESDCESDAESNFDMDSGYASIEEDGLSDNDFYNHFIDRCEKEGPTTANRGESAKKMIRVEEKRWLE
jgi:hypothetical protein